MKKIFPFVALSLLTLFTACLEQEASEDLVPQTTLEMSEPGDAGLDFQSLEPLREKARNLSADFNLETNNGFVDEKSSLVLVNYSTNAASYHWDFGNGHTSTDAVPDYAYELHGDYDITLTVSDAFGNEREVTKSVIVLCIYGGGSHDN